MKTIFIMLLTFLSLPLLASSYKLGAKIFDGNSVPFLKYSGAGPWDNYLIMNLPFEPMADLFKELLLKKRKQLANRGEAHITVVTPIEFREVLKPQAISMQEINDIALSMDIQDSRFKVICLGMGSAPVELKVEETYYIVVTSLDLVAIRKRIQDLFIAKGGDSRKFDSIKSFYPHITLGFTKRDLHEEEDKVFKNIASCQSKLKIVP